MSSLQKCSSTELRTKQKEIEELLKKRQKRKKCGSHASSRSSSKGSRKSIQSRKRSQSHINLTDDFSTVSTCINNINQKYHQSLCGYTCSFSENESKDRNANILRAADEEDDDDEKLLTLSSSLSHLTYSNTMESTEVTSKQYHRLSNAVKRLDSSINDIQENNGTAAAIRCCSKRSQSFYIPFEKRKLPRSHEKDAISKLCKIVDTLTDKLQANISLYIVSRRKDKTRLEVVRNENTILKQRLQNYFTVQQNLEGELDELNKEKKLLEVENKNLAIKIAPFLNDNAGKRVNTKWQPQSGNEFSRNVGSKRSKNCHKSTSIHISDRKIHRCGRSSSVCDVSRAQQYCRYKSYNENDTPVVTASRSVSDSNLTVDSTTDDISKAEEIFIDRSCGTRKITRVHSRTELESIASYVRWKNDDFDRLHGRLHKNFDELQQLKQAMNCMNQEKSEILGDLEDLVDSYRELEKERDNYESILKMILKEKNSAESNIRDLLDSLLVHLNNNTQSSCRQCLQQQQHDEFSTTSAATVPTQNNSCNSRSFLESALHVIQEQNISIREEMARLRESLQTTTGQNMLLQANNETLSVKVNDLQRQVESREGEAEHKEKEQKDKFEKLEKLYNTISSAKDDLEKSLQEREKEITRLNLKNVTDASDKALKDQSDKIDELKEANVKLEKDISRLRISNDKLSQFVKQLKLESKEQKGKLSEQIKNTCSDLQESKKHCTWLANQVENFKTQLLEAHERIKSHESDKGILAHKVLTAEEERKTLDRNIQEIRTMMEADKLYQQALSDRNEVLQLEVNRLRTERLNGDSDVQTKCEQSCVTAKKNGENGDGSGEKKNINNNSVKTTATTVANKATPKPVHPPSGQEKSSNRVNTGKQNINGRYCSCCRGNRPVPPSNRGVPNISSAERTRAAQRLTRALSNGAQRPIRQYPANAKTVASGGLQDSTQKPHSTKRRTVSSSHSIGNKYLNNSLHCTAGKRPLVALVRTQRRPITVN